MTPEEKLKNFITGIKATTELLGLYRDSLIENEFTREEAVGMCADFVGQLLNMAQEG